MQPCKFVFDDSPVFDGFAHGSTWNGFDNVAVTYDQRLKVAQWMRGSGTDPDTAAEEAHDLLAIEPMADAPDRPTLYSLGWGYATQIIEKPMPLPAGAEALIALRFVQVLLSWLSPHEFLEMRALNATETNPKICHSHDYCDANMAMAEAFESIVGRTPDGEDSDNALWNRAWELAMPILGEEVMQIYYVCDNEGPALMELVELSDNFTMTNAGVDCKTMQIEVAERGWFKGVHDNGGFIVLNLTKLKLTLTPEAWDDPMIYPAGNQRIPGP